MTHLIYSDTLNQLESSLCTCSCGVRHCVTHSGGNQQVSFWTLIAMLGIYEKGALVGLRMSWYRCKLIKHMEGSLHVGWMSIWCKRRECMERHFAMLSMIIIHVGVAFFYLDMVLCGWMTHRKLKTTKQTVSKMQSCTNIWHWCWYRPWLSLGFYCWDKTLIKTNLE